MPTTDDIDESELARRMWGTYLHNEWKYDKFGAQGKFILLQEILREDGLPPLSPADALEMVNRIFPRTFACERPRKLSPPLMRTVVRYFQKLHREFSEQDLPLHLVETICLSETAEKFCLPRVVTASLAAHSSRGLGEEYYG